VGLGGAGAAGDHRVDELEVAGVRIEANLRPLLVAGGDDSLGAVVILDVAGPGVGDGGDRLHRLERPRPLELGEDRLHRAPQVVGQDR
jgi:hypothetical protein